MTKKLEWKRVHLQPSVHEDAECFARGKRQWRIFIRKIDGCIGEGGTFNAALRRFEEKVKGM